MRVGIGYDVHKLAKGRKLILGGVLIKHPLGLLGHSDADVLVHAIIDAVIGAMGERDIGFHFPATDPKYKGISSLRLLKDVADLVRIKGYKIENIDSTVVAESPKLDRYVSDMCANLASVLGINKDHVNVKAKTEEGLGYIGKKKGIAAYAVCLLYKANITNLFSS